MTQADVLSGKKPVRRRREEENNQGRLGAQGKVSLQDGSGQGPGGGRVLSVFAYLGEGPSRGGEQRYERGG